MHEHLVIVGGGQAAAQTAISLRGAGYDGAISLVGEEASLPYQRPPLSKRYLSGEMDAARLLLKSGSFYTDNAITVHAQTKAEAVDPASRQVTLTSGEQLRYSTLLLATGSEPRRVALPGAELAGVHYLRRIADVDAIRSEFAPGRKLLIVGAGYIGLEVAAVAAQAGLEVTVLEAATRVMVRSVCERISEFYAGYHRSAGVRLQLNATLAALHGDQRVRIAELHDGTRCECDLVIIGIGVVPRTELAERAGLAISNGVLVDDACRTSVPDILAAGDCASYPHPWLQRHVRLESVQGAIEQAKTAAASIRGEHEPFSAVPWFWSDQFDLKLQIAGLTEGYDQSIVRGQPEDGRFSVFYLQKNRVIAVAAVNDPRNFILARNRLAERPEWSAAAIADTATELA